MMNDDDCVDYDDNDVKVEVSDSDDEDDANNNTGVICFDCGRYVKDHKCLKTHHRKFHEKVICPVDGIEFSGWKKYHNHMQKHQMESCPKCSKEFSRDYIKKHIKNCKGIKKDKYVCEKCNDFSTNVKKQLDRLVTQTLTHFSVKLKLSLVLEFVGFILCRLGIECNITRSKGSVNLPQDSQWLMVFDIPFSFNKVARKSNFNKPLQGMALTPLELSLELSLLSSLS